VLRSELIDLKYPSLSLILIVTIQATERLNKVFFKNLFKLKAEFSQ